MKSEEIAALTQLLLILLGQRDAGVDFSFSPAKVMKATTRPSHQLLARCACQIPFSGWLLFDDAPRSAIDLEAQHRSRIFTGNEILDVSAQELDPLWCGGSPTLFSCSLCGKKNPVFYHFLIFRVQTPWNQVRRRSLNHSRPALSKAWKNANIRSKIVQLLVPEENCFWNCIKSDCHIKLRVYSFLWYVIGVLNPAKNTTIVIIIILIFSAFSNLGNMLFSGSAKSFFKSPNKYFCYKVCILFIGVNGTISALSNNIIQKVPPLHCIIAIVLSYQ